MIRKFLLSTVALGATVLPLVAAYAEEPVAVRFGAHDSYARLVFDWPSLPGYEITQSDPAHLQVAFNRAAASNPLSVLGDIQDPRVAGLRTLNQNPLTVELTIKAGSEYRHFAIGNRLVMDILGQGPAQAAPSAPKPSPKTTAPVQQTKKAKPPPSDVSPAPKSQTPEAAPHRPETVKASPPALHTPPETPAVAAAKPEPTKKTVLDQARALFEPHVISLSATEEIGLAAFTRHGDLWLVLDRPHIQASPQLAGPQKERFDDEFERIELQGGVAYKIAIPDEADLNIYGEGGGLVWRVVLTPAKLTRHPVEMRRIFTPYNKKGRGGLVSWALRHRDRVIDVPDPESGEIIKAVPVSGAAEFTGPARDFVDFSLLSSAVGGAFLPKTDDLTIELNDKGVTVTRPEGLAISNTSDINRSLIREEVTTPLLEKKASVKDLAGQRIFDFDRWMMGGVRSLNDNERLLMAGVGLKDRNGLVADLLTLAKMNLANGRGAEALGYLRFAAQELPEIEKAVQYKALYGASSALTGTYETALRVLSDNDLKDFSELGLWRAYSLAWLEDWQQAWLEMPEKPEIFLSYPVRLLEKLGPKLAEVALRAGEVSYAEKALGQMVQEKDKYNVSTRNAIDYLRGEAFRQGGNTEKAREIWGALVKGQDDFYRARAGLALTELEMGLEQITPKEAIDRLEGLRYAWRGDELEARINYVLGKLYLDEERYVKGFSILREAASMSPNSDIGEEITAHMSTAFFNLLMENKNLSPLQAVTVYEEFTELTPLGDKGNKLVQKLAERLVEADLLERAATILQHQVDYRTEGQEQARVALRLGAIYLLNKEPEKAQVALAVARSYYDGLNSKVAEDNIRRIKLMQARALSEMDKTEEAIAFLNEFQPAPDVNRLRADIAWQAGLWDDAAEALHDLVLDQSLDPTRPLTEEQATLLLNRAVALNLSGNRVALNNMRKTFNEAMSKTSRAKLFDVITRPRQGTLLADRQTLDAIVAEVDIFRDFLESYRSGDPVEN